MADIRELLGRHLAYMRSQSPPENVFALDLAGLLDPAVTLYSYRRDGVLLAIGTMAGFAPARALYASAGFTGCGEFADYRPSPHSTFLSLSLA